MNLISNLSDSLSIPVWSTWCFLLLQLQADEPLARPGELPRIPATELNQVMSTFEVRDGFKMELVAAEPLVLDPVAMDFDEWGKAFVVEMRGYSERRHDLMGRIRLLEDSDQDGSFEDSSIFAKDLPWPTAVTCYDGGVFVGATPDIFYLKDTDDDGVADVKKLVFTGFASASAPYRADQLNMQAMLNSFHWGPDNRIHGATGLAGGEVYSPLRPDLKPVQLRGKDFSFDPRTFEIRAESGGAQNGMSFDSHGRKFVCSNSDHLQYIVYDQVFAGFNPWIQSRSPRVSIAEDGPAAPVFRISPDEPWRIIRTKWRVAGAVSGPIEGGGTPSGYFTGATGATLYTGDAWGSEFLDHAFIADCGSNLIHRKLVYPKGHSMSARRAPDESTIEFVRSTDNWFRPVQFRNGPDGNLYVMDMYREVIEHPWSLPHGIKQHLDLNSGNDRGRIYRIRSDRNRNIESRLPGDANANQLVEMLGHANQWHRTTANRLIHQSQRIHLAGKIREMLHGSTNPFARLHALRALIGLGVLSADDAERAISDDSAVVRKAMLEFFIHRSPGTKFTTIFHDHLPSLILDDQTRFQTVLLLAKHPLKAHKQAEILHQAMSLEKHDKGWMQFAVLNAMHPCSGEFLDLLISKEIYEAKLFDDASEFFYMMGASGNKIEMTKAFRFLLNQPIMSETMDAMNALGEGAQRRDKRLLSLIPTAEMNQAQSKFLNWLQVNGLNQIGLSQKVIQASSQLMSEELKQHWMDWLSQPEWIELHADLMASLISDFAVTDLDWALSQWGNWSPSTRQITLNLIFSRDDLLITFLRAARTDSALLSDLTFSQRQLLVKSRSIDAKQLAEELLGDVKNSNERTSIKEYESALLLEADVSNGHRLFSERCAACHRANGEGYPLGPNLVTVKTSGKNRILDSILFPNREVQPQFMAYDVTSVDGEIVTGLIRDENPAAMTIQQAGGVQQTILRTEMESLQGTGKSMMPQGLLDGLTRQDVADLLEFIVQLSR